MFVLLLVSSIDTVYREKEIYDPDDAEQIALASVEIKSYVYEQYDAAFNELLHSVQQAKAVLEKRREITAQKRRLADEVTITKDSFPLSTLAIICLISE